MTEIIQLLACVGIAFLILYKPGPFDIILKIREKLFSIQAFGLGISFYKLLNCSFCLGFYIGIFIGKSIIFGFSSAILCYILLKEENES